MKRELVSYHSTIVLCKFIIGTEHTEILLQTEMHLWRVITKHSPLISNTNDTVCDTSNTVCLLNQNTLWGIFSNIYLLQEKKKSRDPFYIHKSKYERIRK